VWRKVLIVSLCLIVAVVPVVHAFVFVPFLAAPIFAGSTITVGHALLATLVVSTATYIGINHKKEINYIVQSAQDGLQSLWDRLHPSQQQALTEAAQTSVAGQSTTLNLSDETWSMIYDYAAQNFQYLMARQAAMTTPILANLPQGDRGALYECTAGDFQCYKSYVDRGIAHQITADLYWVPYYVEWDSGNNIRRFEMTTVNITTQKTGMQAAFYTADTNLYEIRILQSSLYQGVKRVDSWFGTSLKSVRFQVENGIYLENVIPGVLAQFDAVAIPRIAAPAIPVPVDYPKKPKDVAIPIPPDVVIPGEIEGTYDISVPIAQEIAQSIPVEGVIDDPVNPPIDFDPPKEGGLNFAPLLLAGQLLKEKFPFSIPWDLKNQLNVFNVTPQAPVIAVNVPNFIKIGNYTIPLNFVIDLTQFDKIAQLTRWFVTLLVDIGFILMIRRLMPE